MKVKRWKTRNDANHNNHHAEVNGVEFFRFPYSSFTSRVGQFTAIVSATSLNGQYSATVYRPNPNRAGDTLVVHFEQDPDQDRLFVWAAAQMKQLQAASKKED